jgi:hypothetical protein
MENMEWINKKCYGNYKNYSLNYIISLGYVIHEQGNPVLVTRTDRYEKFVRWIWKVPLSFCPCFGKNSRMRGSEYLGEAISDTTSYSSGGVPSLSY